MKRNIMIAGSYPSIITSGGNSRVNKASAYNAFLKEYITIFGELLKVKGNLKDIKIAYIGGYTKEENISRAKLYISAYNYFLNYLGYESLSKSNLIVIDTDNIEEISESLEQCDLLFLGIGEDRKLTSIILELESKGINLKTLVNKKNILISSICSGSVMSAEKIYGGRYDNYYYGKDVYEYPLNIQSLNINPVTMETDFCPNDATKEKNEIFIENYLKPDSKKCVFFACKPNSFFLIVGDKIYSYGEIYLFIDGKCLQIENELEKAEVTKVIELIKEYNQIKNRNIIINEELYYSIRNNVLSLRKIPIENDDSLRENVVYEFTRNECDRIEKNKVLVNKWKQDLKTKLDYLFSKENLEEFYKNLELQENLKKINKNIVNNYNVDISNNYLEELYLKTNLISIIKKAYINYANYYSDFKQDLFDVLKEYVSLNDRLVFFVVDTCGCLFSNRELKQLLNAIKLESTKRPKQIIDSTKKQLKLFRKEIKYERS